MTHPCCITRCKVIIHRHDMNSFSRQCIQIRRQCCNKSFSLSRSHFCNICFMQNNSSQQLHIIRDHVPGHRMSFNFFGRATQSFTRLFYRRKRFYQKIISRCSCKNSFFKFCCFSFYLFIRKRFSFCIQRIDLFDKWSIFV